MPAVANLTDCINFHKVGKPDQVSCCLATRKIPRKTNKKTNKVTLNPSPCNRLF